MPNSINELHPFGTQESEILEFKESLSEREKAGEVLCSFANKDGGTLYFGVKNNGDLIGVSGATEKP